MQCIWIQKTTRILWTPHLNAGNAMPSVPGNRMSLPWKDSKSSNKTMRMYDKICTYAWNALLSKDTRGGYNATNEFRDKILLYVSMLVSNCNVFPWIHSRYVWHWPSMSRCRSPTCLDTSAHRRPISSQQAWLTCWLFSTVCKDNQFAQVSFMGICKDQPVISMREVICQFVMCARCYLDPVHG